MKNFFKNAALLWLSISGNVLGQRQNTQLIGEDWSVSEISREQEVLLYNINTLQYMIGVSFLPNPHSTALCSELYPSFDHSKHILYKTPKTPKELHLLMDPCLSLTNIMFTEEWLKGVMPRINLGLTINVAAISTDAIKKLFTETLLGTQVLRITSAPAENLDIDMLSLFLKAGIKEIYIELQGSNFTEHKMFASSAFSLIMDTPADTKPNVFAVGMDYVHVNEKALKTASLVKCKYGEQYGDCLDRVAL